MRPPPRSTLFPYATLFRSGRLVSVLCATRNDAPVAGSARWTRNPRHRNLVCAHHRRWTCNLEAVGFLVGAASLCDLLRALCLHFRFTLAREQPRNCIQDGLDE